jgi:hypothetical protein
VSRIAITSRFSFVLTILLLHVVATHIKRNKSRLVFCPGRKLMSRFRLYVAAAAIVAFSNSAYAVAPAAVPDLIWYQFNEPAGSTTTANLAVPGAGFALAPITGHLLGGGVLTGVGGGSATNFVDTGWNGATGTNSFSVYFELNNSPTANTALDYFFGNSSVGQRAFDDGVAGDTGIAFRFGGGNFATALGASTPGSSHEVAFVFDTTVDEGYAFVDGTLVNTVTGLTTVNITPGQFKVAGYSTNIFNALQAGTTLNDFRVYGRALSAIELVPEPGSLTAMLLAPVLLAFRRRR